MFFMFVLGIVVQIYGIKFEFCRKPMIICEKLLTSSSFWHRSESFTQQNIEKQRLHRNRGENGVKVN